MPNPTPPAEPAPMNEYKKMRIEQIEGNKKLVLAALRGRALTRRELSRITKIPYSTLFYLLSNMLGLSKFYQLPAPVLIKKRHRSSGCAQGRPAVEYFLA